MKIKVTGFDIHILNTRLRFPFRYGIAALTALPHAFVRVEIEVDGKRQWGVTADGLAPKWFTKNKDETFRDELAAMFHVIETAGGIAKDAKPASSVYDLWQHLYTTQMQWATREGYPPLLWNFGVSLIERAVMDAFCRATGTSFARAVRENAFGLELGEIHRELDGATAADLLPKQPLTKVKMRRTIGLGDPIADKDIPAEDLVNDGLPQALEASIRAYGLSRFKIKSQGNLDVDVKRLTQLYSVLEEHAPKDYAFTLDLNEFFTDPAAFRDYWINLRTHKQLDALFGHMLVVEQPMYRDAALSAEASDVLNEWDDRPPIIIDESDGLLSSLPDALGSGYAGTSFKSCKGVVKGIANACLIEHHRRNDPAGRYVLTCEDLCILGPVSLGHDLAAIATLGIDHCERAGVHYFAGISHLPEEMQRQALEQHGDLYLRHERGFVSPRIEKGELDLTSTVAAPFGLGYLFDPTRFTPLDEWRFESLGLA